MKNILLLTMITLVSSITSVISQDIIIKKTGEEVKVKVTEVGLENIKYKKHDNIEGPTYTIPKYEVFIIKYENGGKDVFTEIKKSKLIENQESLRKGMHLGLHFTPGAGAILATDYKLGGGVNTGIDLSTYFNDYIGIKTGFSFLYLPIKYDYTYYVAYKQPMAGEAEGKISSIGIPVKFLLTTGNNNGFYFESGLNIYVPVSSSIDGPRLNTRNIYYDEFNNYNLSHEQVVIAQETVLGLNFKTSEIINVNIGLSSHYSLTKNFSNKKTRGVLIGLQMGVLFKLTK